MGLSKYTLILEWENNKSFEMKSKKNEEGNITIVKIEENQHYPDVRSSVETICKTFFEKTLKEIGDEMIV